MNKKLRTPAMFVNFKSYREVDGEGALKFAKICESVSNENDVSIIVCPPVVELGTIARNVCIPVFSQNVDYHVSGPGWITASMINSTGEYGTLIKHSEQKFE
ncbi:MAG: triose-phosphate isomerase, partial [archaeon]|nr:triose-phosphate isomerase [archaeon]